MQRSTKSVLMAAGLAAAVGAWMLTGLGRGSDTPVSAPGAAHNVMRVSVRTSQARTITREIVVSARTEPNRVVELRAETDGRVVALGAERGSAIAAGDRIATLDVRDRETRRDEARAVIAYMELQFEAARKLQTQQFVSETQIAEAASRVATARSALASIELEIENTALVAPFEAVLQDRLVELGDYVSSGDTVAELVDTDPLIVVGEVSERDVAKLVTGNKGFARLADDENVEGVIRYVSPVADENTRTFRVELAVPNPDARLRAGMSAELRLAADQITAHFLSPALLTLDDGGAVGVKAVDEFDRVQFYSVDIVSSSSTGISVMGLPGDVRLITIGQGFVKAGELVEPVVDPGFTPGAEQPKLPEELTSTDHERAY